ncbi:putative dihydrofolate synthetase fol3 [Phaeomoniella chlamydospora]|uniref:Dihydrofolate synthetase n=1 Tax=Phaeomoniella chlamydospora TaxID=158046 RepID=A0A0G2ENN0_PHACM|nr:putative dihydrofolate synthetase fol3 [Phaeomoniella chlamydospora]
MIELGLARIAHLVPKQYTWKAVHVAGTNGKGSICAYLSAMIKEAGFRPARFNSPHLIDRWDCISINDFAVERKDFEKTEQSIKIRDQELHINASEFELLAATAFELFNASQPPIDYGVIEVGLGGRLDATNVLSNIEVSIIAKIGLDHQVQLGNTILEIAREKAGIMRPKVPCIIDGTNEREVLEALQDHACKVGTPVALVTADSRPETYAELQPVFNQQDLEPHQRANLLVATEAMKMLMSRCSQSVKGDTKNFLDGVRKVQWPGRMQRLGLEQLTGRQETVLLDGAHNLQSAEALAAHVDRTMRHVGRSVTWVIAASQGKDLGSILTSCLHNNDKLIPVTFGPVDGMPWVHSMTIDDIVAAVKKIPVDVEIVNTTEADGNGLVDRLRLACDVANEGPLVIAGSLYLVSDVLRLLRSVTS